MFNDFIIFFFVTLQGPVPSAWKSAAVMVGVAALAVGGVVAAAYALSSSGSSAGDSPAAAAAAAASGSATADIKQTREYRVGVQNVGKDGKNLSGIAAYNSGKKTIAKVENTK